MNPYIVIFITLIILVLYLNYFNNKKEQFENQSIIDKVKIYIQQEQSSEGDYIAYLKFIQDENINYNVLVLKDTYYTLRTMKNLNMLSDENVSKFVANKD
jgi:hypothetical protein